MLLINKGEYTQFGRVFGPKIYAYIGGIFALTGIGFWIQTYMVPQKEEEKPAANNANANTETKPAEKQPETTANNNQPTQAHTEVPATNHNEAGKPEEKAADNEVKGN